MTHHVRAKLLHTTPLAIALPAIAGLIWVALSGAGRPTAGADALGAPRGVAAAPQAEWRPLDPAKVEGHIKCVDCHQSEVRAWLQSKHGAHSFDMLRTNPNSREYAKKLGIAPERIAKDSLCTKCHATQEVAITGRLQTLGGVSCESCHGASGGEDGWLNFHAVYGPPGTPRQLESPQHKQRRLTACSSAGQYRSADIYALAKSCYECHLVPEEELVVKAGHPTGTFEMVEWSQGEVRHNFHQNQRQNAETPSLWSERTGATPIDRKRLLFLVGQLVDIEVSLRSLAESSDPGFAVAAGTRVLTANGTLAGVHASVPLPELQRAQDAVAKITDKLFQPPLPEQRGELEEAADLVAAAAKDLAQNYNGSTLSGIDAFLPQGQKGPVFQPR